MIELQPVPDDRPLREQFISADELMAMGDDDAREWEIIWGKRGYAHRQCKQLRSAFADLESAWIVFWQSGDPDRALWRLVDAAGQLAELFPADRVEATGRGYRVEKVAPWCKRGHRWHGQAPPQQEDVRRPRPAKPPRPERPRTPPKPVALDPRRVFTPLQKAEIFLRSNGHCCACGIELGEVWHADHIVPHAWGGVTEVRNGQVGRSRC